MSKYTSLSVSFGMICLLYVGLSACQSIIGPITGTNEGQIPFTTIATEEWGGGYKSMDPQVYLLTESANIAEIAEFVKPEHLEQLHQIDFVQDAVVAVFRGIQPGSNHKVVIARILREDALLTVYAQFWQPAPNQGSAAVETSPYHLVKIPKAKAVPVPADVKLVSDVVQP